MDRENPPLYSRKLHMRVRRARTSCETSLTIFAFSLGDSVENHFARRYKGERERERWPSAWRRGGVSGQPPTTGTTTHDFALPREQDQIT
jgi:hypothetical protein